jgi:hypothetical protein
MSHKHHPFWSRFFKIFVILVLGIPLASLTLAGQPLLPSGSFIDTLHPSKYPVNLIFNEYASHSPVDVSHVVGSGGRLSGSEMQREVESWQWPPSSHIERAHTVDSVIRADRSSRGTSLGFYNLFPSQIFQLDLSSPLIADGQFVWGPNVGDFEIRGYLESINSALTPYSDDIEIWARYSTVNPMVLLTVLELQHGYVNSLTDDHPPEKIRNTIENTSMDLAVAFYEHLHTWGTRRSTEGLKDPNPVVVFADGTTAQLSTDHSSGSFAIAATLAKSTDVITWLEQISIQSSEGFTSVFGALFPETDLLDNSNDINPPILPAADLFQFPFPLGATWYFNGPHSWAGDDTPPFSSMDFYTGGGTCDSPPNTYTVAAQSGTAIRPYGYDCWLEIDHVDGWTTSYYHLQNMIDPQGETINRNASLGTIACEVCAGGWASGPHVHWTLKYNGAYVSLEGVRVSGWTIHVGPEPYDTGYIERDGQTLDPFNLVVNDYHLYYPQENNSLRFQGNGEDDIDRVKIPINDPPRPADLGSTDFTIEWWMKTNPGENNAGSCTPGGENWTSGNHILDRSTHDEDGSAELGVSLADGRIAFGVDNGTESDTLCGITDVADGDWHHVAITRGLDGTMRIFIDGTLDAETTGPSGDIGYPDDHVETHPHDPYLVIGAEKFDLNPILYPSFSGWIDEIHASNILRYVGNFTPSTEPVFPDGSSVALYHFDEGIGDFINDTSGAWGGPSNGFLSYGGDPAGPEWSTDTPIISSTPEELLGNGEFETFVPNYWKGNNLTDTDGPDCKTSASGSCSATMSSNGDVKQITYVGNSSGNAGDNLNFRLWNMTSNAGGPFFAKVVLVYIDSTQEMFKILPDKGTHDWQYYDLDFTAAKDYNRVKIFLVYGAGVGSVWFDEVSLVEGLSSTELLNGGTYEVFVPNGWRGIRLDGNDGPDCTTSASGNCSAKLIGSGDVKQMTHVAVESGSAGDNLTFKFWTRADGSIGPFFAKIVLVYTDSSQEMFKILPDKGTHGWQYYDLDFTATKNYDRIRVFLVYGAVSGDVWFDDVSLKVY